MRTFLAVLFMIVWGPACFLLGKYLPTKEEPQIAPVPLTQIDDRTLYKNERVALKEVSVFVCGGHINITGHNEDYDSKRPSCKLLTVKDAHTIIIRNEPISPTKDQEVKWALFTRDHKIVNKFHTVKDYSDPNKELVVMYTVDGDVTVKPNETKYFEIDANHDDYTKSGGWYWRCDKKVEKTRINGASLVRVIRTGNANEWSWVELQPLKPKKENP